MSEASPRPIKGEPCTGYRIGDLRQAAREEGAKEATRWDKEALCNHFGLSGPAGRYSRSSGKRASGPNPRSPRPAGGGDKCSGRTVAALREDAKRLSLKRYTALRRAALCARVLKAEREGPQRGPGDEFDDARRCWAYALLNWSIGEQPALGAFSWKKEVIRAYKATKDDTYANAGGRPMS